MPRGAGPPFFSPTRLYFEPWQGHSNHCEDQAPRHPAAEVGHFWNRATNPASMPGSTESEYTALARGSAASG